MFQTTAALAAAASCAIAAAALAETSGKPVPDFSGVIAARQGQFAIMDYNLGVLEQMVAGDIDYDAETARLRALNIDLATGLSQDRNWLPGSDQPDVAGTRAQAVREDVAAFKSNWERLLDDADLLLVAAAEPDELGPAVARMRDTCAACHGFYRPATR